MILRRCADGYRRLSERIGGVVAFFSANLFEKLDQWGRHENSQFQLEAEVEDGFYRLKYTASWNDREFVVLRPDMDKLMRRGKLPEFE